MYCSVGQYLGMHCDVEGLPGYLGWTTGLQSADPRSTLLLQIFSRTIKTECNSIIGKMLSWCNRNPKVFLVALAVVMSHFIPSKPWSTILLHDSQNIRCLSIPSEPTLYKSTMVNDINRDPPMVSRLLILMAELDIIIVSAFLRVVSIQCLSVLDSVTDGRDMSV